MPSSTVKQAKVMSAIAHGWHPSEGSVAKIPVKVAKDFHAADAGHKYGKGMHKGDKTKKALRTARKYSKKAEGGKIKKNPFIHSTEGLRHSPNVEDRRGEWMDKFHDTNYFPPEPGPSFNPGEAIGQMPDALGAASLDRQLAGFAEGGEVDDDKQQAINIHPVDPFANYPQGAAFGVGSPAEMSQQQVGFSPAAEEPHPPEKVLYPTASPLVNITDQDIERGINVAMSSGTGAMSEVKKGKKALMALDDAMELAASHTMGSHPENEAIYNSLKKPYPKDLAQQVFYKGYNSDEVNNINSYLLPGAQDAYWKYLNKLGYEPKAPNAPSLPSEHPDFIQNYHTAQGVDYDKVLANIEAAIDKVPSNLGGNFGDLIWHDDLTKIGDALGTNPGGVYTNAAGEKFYMKQGKTPDHIKNEKIAAALYDAAGTPTLRYRPVADPHYIATEWANKEKDNAYKFTPKERTDAQQDFAVHAWLANHDVVGTGGDNLGMVGGKPTALDLGGALEYRAQGAPKGNAFGNTVGELDSMRGLTPGIHAPDAEKMFGDMSNADLEKSALKVVSIPDQKIKAIVAAHGGDPALADKLIARKKDIADRFQLHSLDPNYLDQWTPKDQASLDAFKARGLDTDVEDYYAHQEKHEQKDWEPADWEGKPHSNWEHEHDPVIIHDTAPFIKWKQGALSKTAYMQEMRSHIKPSNWMDYRPKDVKPEELPPTNWGKNDPAYLRSIGVNTDTHLFKGGEWNTWGDAGPDPFVPGGYPKVLMDPNIKHAEQSFHLASKPGIAESYHGAKNIGGSYVAWKPKFAEFDWPSFFGSNHYSDGDLDGITKEAKKMGLDMVAVHNMHDVGSATHGLHTQYLVLNTNVLRAPHAAFDPQKWHLRYPLAGIAGTAAGAGIYSYGDEDNHFAHGGRVKAEKALPANHQLGMKVPKGGSMCANCKFLASPTTCGNKGFIEWNGKPELPAPADEYCCDLYGHDKPEHKAEGGGTRFKDFRQSDNIEDRRKEHFRSFPQAPQYPNVFDDGTMSGLSWQSDFAPTPANNELSNAAGANQLDDKVEQYLAARQAKGGKVAKKEEDPKDHEFINFAKGGLINSDIPGRTDKIPMKVPPGSYVLPADIPSALGQGNTSAGSEILSKMFTHSAYGLKPMTQKGSRFTYPSFPTIGHSIGKAEGGRTNSEHVPIIAAGGEYIIHPDVVKAVGHGDISKGHEVLDRFVLRTRKEHIKTLKGLKGPKQ